MIGKITWRKNEAVYTLDGKEVTEKEFYETIKPSEGAPLLSCIKPHASDALAIHPRQIAEAMAKDKKRGVPTEYLPDGRPIITSRAHQKAYLKAYPELGLHNKDGGYGD